MSFAYVRRAHATHPIAADDAVAQVAHRLGITPAQFALAWVAAQSDDVVPIPGTTKPERVSENAAALDLELSRDVLDELERVAPVGAAAG